MELIPLTFPRFKKGKDGDLRKGKIVIPRTPFEKKNKKCPHKKLPLLDVFIQRGSRDFVGTPLKKTKKRIGIPRKKR